MEAWFSAALDIEVVLADAVESDIHLFVADVTKTFDRVDRGILDQVLRFRHAYFEFHAHVLLRFKLAAGFGQPWRGLFPC